MDGDNMAIILAIALSLDALGMGISCGLRRQKLDFFAYASLFVVSMVVMAFSVFFGNIIASFLSPDIAMLVAALWIIALGIWIGIGALRKNDDDFIPEKITKKGSLQLALVLSLDSMGAGLAAASLGISIIFLPFLVAAFQIAFLALGAHAATWLRLKSAHGRRWTMAAGILLVAMGVIRLI